MTKEFIKIITTTDSKEEAYNIAQALLDEKLAVCVQISGPLDSIYHWEGEIQQEQEWKCDIKTEISLYEKAEEIIKEIHSYEIPEIIVMPIIGGSDEYYGWMEGELK